MKRRIGFVSNSSSASYCILGFSVPELDYDDVEDMLAGPQCPELRGMDALRIDDAQFSPIVGRMILWISSDDWAEDKTLDIPLDISDVEIARKHLGVDTPIKLYSGTVAC